VLAGVEQAIAYIVSDMLDLILVMTIARCRLDEKEGRRGGEAGVRSVIVSF
jgi:hypothetical protein